MAMRWLARAMLLESDYTSLDLMCCCCCCVCACMYIYRDFLEVYWIVGLLYELHAKTKGRFYLKEQAAVDN